MAADNEVLAAVDLGSNSFHMVVARLSHGELTVIDRLREMVRLRSGLDRQRRLDTESKARALACLARFGERLRAVQADRVRVVGTNTLRYARGTRRFLADAQQALGHPVEIISGIEEARLIHLGATHNLPRVPGSRIIVDIGGGSTEIILGQGFEPVSMGSISIGCVSISERHFPKGRLTVDDFTRARLAVGLELEPVRLRFEQVEPAQVAGTSGTIRAVANVLAAYGHGDDAITPEGIERLIREMVAVGHVTALQLPGIPPERAEVLPGGVAILAEVMRALELGTMRPSEGPLREGVLYDMLGRLGDEDARERTVRSMAARYHVDLAQATRVETTAMALLKQVIEAWDLGGDSPALMLSWAARLHEVGLDIAHAQHHRHGAYLLENADMSGFTRDEQRVLACMVRSHRRKFERRMFSRLPPYWSRRAMRLALLLRLAVLFNRGRARAAWQGLQLRVKGRTLRLALPADWLAARALTLADLERERDYLVAAGIRLHLEPMTPGE